LGPLVVIWAQVEDVGIQRNGAFWRFFGLHRRSENWGRWEYSRSRNIKYLPGYSILAEVHSNVILLV
jgi:hypothetical protein